MDGLHQPALLTSALMAPPQMGVFHTLAAAKRFTCEVLRPCAVLHCRLCATAMRPPIRMASGQGRRCTVPSTAWVCGSCAVVASRAAVGGGSVGALLLSNVAEGGTVAATVGCRCGRGWQLAAFRGPHSKRA